VHLSLVDVDPFADIHNRILKGKDHLHLLDSPLHGLKDKIVQNRIVLKDARNQAYDMGAYFHPFGKDKVDGMNLHARLIKNGEMTEIDFQVTHVFREHLTSVIELFNRASKDPVKLQSCLSFAQSKAASIKVDQVPYGTINNKFVGDAHRLTFEGLGTVYIGSDPAYPNLYDRIVVHIDSNKNLFDLHELLSLVDLDDTLRGSSVQDIERLKIGMLYRAFCPEEATRFERNKNFFSISIEALKFVISGLNPKMREIFELYLPKMRAIDILPGRKRYIIPGLAQKIYEAGGRGLITFISRENLFEQDKIFDDAIAIWKMGFLAPSIRPHHTTGLLDFYAASGSDDCNWAQLVTERDCRAKTPLSDFGYFSQIKFTLSLEHFERGTYQYYNSFYGFRSPKTKIQSDAMEVEDDDDKIPTWNDYLKRPSALEFTRKLQDSFIKANEVMLKEAAHPLRMILPDQKTLDDFIAHLGLRGMVCNGMIEGLLSQPIPIKDFIQKHVYVGTKASEELFA
jgi:hypothetical protein